jgi:hypothetical protein
MTQPTSPLLVPSALTRERERPTAPMSIRTDAAWTVLGITGVAFAFLGAVDQSLVWYPPAFGSPEWEFGSVTAAFNALPVPVLGVMMAMVAGLGRRQRWLVRTASIILVCVAVAVLVAGLLYALTVPVALSRINNDVVRTGLLKAIAKTVLQTGVYPLLFLTVAWKGWKADRIAHHP